MHGTISLLAVAIAVFDGCGILGIKTQTANKMLKWAGIRPDKSKG
jgi:hypothetical protein